MLPVARAAALLGVLLCTVSGAWVTPKLWEGQRCSPLHDLNRMTQILSSSRERVLLSGSMQMSTRDVPCRRRPPTGHSRRGLLKGATLAILGLTVATSVAAPSEAKAIGRGAWRPGQPPQQSQDELEEEGRRLWLDQPPHSIAPTGVVAAAATGEEEEEERSSGLSEFLSGLAGGAASRASKELLLHPIDTIKTRLQFARAGGEVPPEELFKDLYSGVWPALLVGTPAGAAFFGTKDLLKGLAKQQWGGEYRELTTIAAVFLANLPYWGIRTPAEVVKTRQQTGLANSTLSAVASLYEQEGGLAGLYSGLGSNVAYAFPADAIKFLVYEWLQRHWASSLGRRKLNPLESSVCGSAASCVAQVLSTPLDVVRTRLMTQGPAASQGGEVPYTGIGDCLQRISREEGPAKLFSGLVPRLTRAVLSGAIQFSSYEVTKGFFSKNKQQP